MTTLIQFVVLKREDRWVVKSTALERAFPDQRRAVEAAIKLAHDSGKEGKPGVVLFQRTKTDFQKVWTYGESTYPPSKRDLRITLPSPKLREAASASLGHQPHLSLEQLDTRKEQS
jgi:hypothetical protein